MCMCINAFIHVSDILFLLTFIEGQDWACSADMYPGCEWQLRVLGLWGIGKAEQDAGPLMTPLGPAAERTPSVRGGLMGWGQVHSSSSSEDCGGWGAGVEGGAGSKWRWATSDRGNGISREWRIELSTTPPSPPAPPWWGDGDPLCCSPPWGEPTSWGCCFG